jgi:fructokinase
MSDNKNHSVVCFGEVLWDILPTGAEPGGAPMNVAYHLNKLNKNPALITKIGIDEEGKKLMDIFSNYGVCTDFFQLDYKYQTGKVFAHPNEDNEVIYDIVKPVAWDFISWENEFAELLSNASFFVFGSLAARNKESKNTLFKLLEIAKNKVLDINLRAPHYNRKIVEELLKKADFLKMNIAELELITGWFSRYSAIGDRINSIRDKFNINNMVVTMGGNGALLYMNGDTARHNGFKVTVEDTVGSGDAFLAGLLSKLLDNAESSNALEFASGLGAFIATKKGACPDYELNEVDQLISNNRIKI